MQLRHETEIRLRDPPLRLDERHGLAGRPAKPRHQKRAHDTGAAADALHAVHEDPSLGIAQGLADEGGGGGEVRSELGEGVVFDGHLGAVDGAAGVSGGGGVGGDVDEAWHCGEYVGDAEGGEEGGVLCVC